MLIGVIETGERLTDIQHYETRPAEDAPKTRAAPGTTFHVIMCGDGKRDWITFRVRLKN